MTYRDETEGLRSRVADLESALAEANEKVARLSGEGPRIATGDQVKESALIGAPTQIVCERVLDFEIADEAFERIAAAVRGKLSPAGGQVAQVAQVGRTLQGPGFFLESRDGRTRVRMEGDYRALPMGAISCAGLGGGFMGFAAFAFAHDFFFRSLAEGHILWMILLAVLAMFPLARRIAARTARKQHAALRASFETVLEIARKGARVVSVSGEGPVRVAATAHAEPRPANDDARAHAVATEEAAMDEALSEEAGVRPAATRTS